jgi:transcriptional regulator with XRE-family HTH domain
MGRTLSVAECEGIKNVLRTQNKTQANLARELHISYGRLAAILNGFQTVPIDLLSKIKGLIPVKLNNEAPQEKLNPTENKLYMDVEYVREMVKLINSNIVKSFDELLVINKNYCSLIEKLISEVHEIKTKETANVVP